MNNTLQPKQEYLDKLKERIETAYGATKNSEDLLSWGTKYYNLSQEDLLGKITLSKNVQEFVLKHFT